MSRSRLLVIFVGFALVSQVGRTYALVGAETNPTERTWLTYTSQKVVVEGIFVVEEKYGPPNYGETPKTDKKVHIYVLRLNPPVNVHPDPGAAPDPYDADTYTDVKEVQLVINFEGGVEKYIGKKVRIEGSLFEKENANHYTDVLMMANAISIEDK